MQQGDQASRREPAVLGGTRQVLNVGSGAAGGLHPVFRGQGWREVRFDIDAAVLPDIVGSLLDLSKIVGKTSYDAVWCSHVLEHVHTHEVVPALRQFRHSLTMGGFALISCPDLKAVARFLITNGAEAVAYESRIGPIRALDMIYGHARSISQGRIHMAHHTGFTRERLARVALDAGFSQVRVLEGSGYDLWALLLMPEADIERLEPLFSATHLRALFDAESATEGFCDLTRE